MFHVPNHYRITTHPQYGSSPAEGNNGAFRFTVIDGRELLTIASDGEGWEHVSVSVAGNRQVPTWAEMAYVKSLFWDDEDAVMQLHPPRSQYVNQHPGCLHLWRPTSAPIPLPPWILVGTRRSR